MGSWISMLLILYFSLIPSAHADPSDDNDSGSVVGGVIGVKKYIYDVFGDTINIGSRMLSCSDPMKICVLEATYERVKMKYDFVEKEPLEVKGKGMMKMYFLTSAG